MKIGNIEYLASMGKPESIKTKKQGRQMSIRDSLKDTPNRPRLFDYTDNRCKVDCAKILRFGESTKKQKEIAHLFLGGDLDVRWTVRDIRKSLTDKFGRSFINI